MKKIEKITPSTNADLIKSQKELIETLTKGIKLRDQLIEKQRELIEILKKEANRNKWWSFGKW